MYIIEPTLRLYKTIDLTAMHSDQGPRVGEALCSPREAGDSLLEAGCARYRKRWRQRVELLEGIPHRLHRGDATYEQRREHADLVRRVITYRMVIEHLGLYFSAVRWGWAI